METPNECTQDRKLSHEPETREVMNDESIEAKVREILEEWNEQGETSKLNRFKSLSINQTQPPDK